LLVVLGLGLVERELGLVERELGLVEQELGLVEMVEREGMEVMEFQFPCCS